MNSKISAVLMAFSFAFLAGAPVDASAAEAAPAQLQLGTHPVENKFDKEKLQAKPGQTVKLTFKNTSKGMQHNFVLTEIGAADEVATAGIQAGDKNGWVPENSPKVLAKSKLLNPGQTEVITFKAPAKAGDYPYVCTFPGHSITMKGVLQVK